MEEISLFDSFGLDKCTKKEEIKDPNFLYLETTTKEDKYTKYVKDTFDLTQEDACKVKIPNRLRLEKLKEWNIGVICGASGTGKSTILKHIGNGVISETLFDNSIPVISNFTHCTPREAAFALSSMGLASVPAWIRPYNALSNGEQYRAQMAKIVSEIGNEIILIDEYTSVVDRNVAKSMSNALQKYIRSNKKKIILATCHYDVFEWLMPDWIYDLNKGGAFEECDYLRQGRPKIGLQVFRTTTDTWDLFKKHHYMTEDLNKAAQCFCFTWESNLVAFYAILPFPNGTIKNGVRGHRLVVLPDFQGLGIGSKVSEFIAGVYKSKGYTLYCKTINPRLGEYRNKNNKKWMKSSTNQKKMSEKEVSKEHNIMGGLTRPSYCHSYIGEPILGFEDLIRPIDEMIYDKNMKGQLTLF